jgi:phage/plasmid-like protein (TIGR03299 family)
MSQETATWLNAMTLIGFTEKRGRAWHYRAEEQGDESNHYEGPVPVEDVRRRLFAWHTLEGEVNATVVTDDGVLSIPDPSRKAILRPPGAFGPDDKGAWLGVFKDGYQGHQYDEWLLSQVATILDDDLHIGSAGLLKQGAIGWVEVTVPESLETPEGVVFRPNLLATTSFDGSIQTTYKRCVTDVVCDNTRTAALGEAGQEVKVKHSRNSDVKLGEMRDALAIVHSIADDFSQQVAELCAIKVSDGDWAKFLDEITPMGDEQSERSRSMAEKKRAGLQRLWDNDIRVAPWRGTAHGVVQAVNTYVHHEGIVRGVDRAERNMLRAVTGGVDALDRSTLDGLNRVIARA